ncbi:MAG TPA: glycoside hydrolase family 127 protein, partial [Firmicutes bacterium]|nr:glycoside hydrolase family 127 protein [Bacillota bacterium]
LVHMAEKPEFKAVYEPDLLDGVVSITSNGRRMKTGGWENALYAFDTPDQYEDISLKWVPYYAWANRSLGEMTVWVRK